MFDPLKLRAINAKYIKKLAPEEFLGYAEPYIRQSVKRQDVDISKIAALLQDRTEIFTDIPETVDFIDSLPEYEPSLYCHKKMKTNEENSLETLKAVLPVLESIPQESWNEETLHEKLFELIAQMGVKNGIVLWPLRVAVSGKAFTPGGGIEICAIIGREDSLERVKKGIGKLS